MEKRKLQKVGYSTLSISLPTQWVKRVGLKKGDTVDCSWGQDGSLRLMPTEVSYQDKNVEINMDLCSEHKLLERLIVGCYIVGYDTITIHSQKGIHNEWLSTIRETAFKLVGLSIMQEKSDVVTLQCSLDPSSTPLVTMIRRLFALTVTMYNDFLESLLHLNIELVKQVINRESESDKIYWLILRTIGLAQKNVEIAEKVGVKDLRLLLGYRLVSKYLETIADYLVANSVHLLTLIESNKKPNKNIIKDLHAKGESSLKIFSGAFESLITDDLKKACKFAENKETIGNDEEKIFDTILNQVGELEMAVHLRCINRGFQRISEYAISIAHVAINMYVEKPSEIIKPISVESLLK